MEKLALLTDSYFSGMTDKIYTRLSQDYQDSRWTQSTIDDTWFACGEVMPKIADTVRGRDVFYIHDMNHPDVNSGWARLLLSIDAIGRADANRLCLVLPCMTYSRQDRKAESRVPISAKVIADTIQMNDVVRKIQTLELHSNQIQGMYRRPLDDLSGRILFVPHLRDMFSNDLENLVVYSTDAGGLKEARKTAEGIDPSVRSYDVAKDRSGVNQVQLVKFPGKPKEKNVVIRDDLADTGNSLIQVAEAAYDQGAKTVTAAISHWVGSQTPGKAPLEERMRDSGINLVTTNSIPRSSEYYDENADWLTVLPLDELFACTIYNASVEGGSISQLFKNIPNLQLGKLHEMFLDNSQ